MHFSSPELCDFHWIFTHYLGVVCSAEREITGTLIWTWEMFGNFNQKFQFFSLFSYSFRLRPTKMGMEISWVRHTCVKIKSCRFTVCFYSKAQSADFRTPFSVRWLCICIRAAINISALDFKHAQNGYSFIHRSWGRQLQVKYLAHGYKGARPVGFEPTTLGLRVKRSTNEPQHHTRWFWLVEN